MSSSVRPWKSSGTPEWLTPLRASKSEQNAPDGSASVIDHTAGSILVVDDDTEMNEVLSAILHSAGYAVVTVNRAVLGLQAIREREFDAIVCDIVMPNLPGDMFHLAVQKLKPHLSERFIFITGHGADPKVSEFLERVSCPTLYKPFGMDDLLAVIFHVMSRTGSRGTA